MGQLLNEIQEQPEVLRRLIADESAHIASIAAQIRRRDVRWVLIAARGTSGHAGVYARYVWGSLNRLPVAMAAPSLYTLYDSPLVLRDVLVVGISQSGQSPDIVAVLEDARRQGASTLAITNATASPLAQAADFVIDCRAGEERAVAATKSYTAQLLVVALLSAALAEDAALRAQIERLPEAVAATLSLDGAAAQTAERYCHAQQMALVGRGYNYASALEIALKLKELSYTSTMGYSAADFQHGPIAVVQPGYPVLLVAPGGATSAGLEALAHTLAARGADMTVISDQPAILNLAQRPLPLPVAVEEWLSPVTAVVPGQLLGYHLAVARGLDAEHPRGLSKVTETR